MSPALKQKRERDKQTAAMYGHERRVELLKLLAPDGCCAKCGRRPRGGVAALQIDHVDGRDWVPRQHNRWTRAARYWREYLAGVRLRALCKKCNGSYRPPGYRDRWTKQREAEHYQKQLEMENAQHGNRTSDLEPVPF